MLLIKNAQIFSPKFIGRKDIFVCNGKIVCIDENLNPNLPNLKVIEASKFIATPGLIDKHVHITGGGGEGGFKTRVPEIMLSKFIEAGITTAVGLLGTDSATRSVENLVAKANALNDEGITCYAHTGAYNVQTPTITGDIQKDIVFVDKIIGIKLAISDHRSSSVSKNELARIVSAGRVAGMISSKSGHTTLHMGDGKKGLGLVYEALEEFDIPITFFQPTHVNRNENLFNEAVKFLKDGGYIDLTCKNHLSPLEAIKRIKSQGLSTDRITVSSDGYGSFSSYDADGKLLEIGVASVRALFEEFLSLVNDGFGLEEALVFFTTNVANSIAIADKKGKISIGYDADLLLFDENLGLEYVIAKGEILKDENGFIKKGTYEY
ncbi:MULTISPECIES: beta-aspartyl-peptidase [Campylobacter]|uniref:Isoaspartyl dipeptidase n=1 Tax=Campylobacter curvus (strain 525.92) TaxID=360105 RepID=A7GZJ7_CAMC5|nr:MULTISPECIES: beta-aspartyl-peptidase [Campylobacter]EAU01318.2 isoaspartyl dipeptidase [Campylobacter curvus 525.92]EJP75164.1 beta-aspartyl peptidase [Campylobacter sp. FOBRC14]